MINHNPGDADLSRVQLDALRAADEGNLIWLDTAGQTYPQIVAPLPRRRVPIATINALQAKGLLGAPIGPRHADYRGRTYEITAAGREVLATLAANEGAEG